MSEREQVSDHSEKPVCFCHCCGRGLHPAVFSIAVPNGRETQIFKQDSLRTSSSNLVVLVGRRAKQASHFLETILRLLENRQICEMGWATPAARIAESGPEPSCFTLAPYFSLSQGENQMQR